MDNRSARQNERRRCGGNHQSKSVQLPRRGVVVIVVVKSGCLSRRVWGMNFEKMGVNGGRVI
jgi:hypothetical protein